MIIIRDATVTMIMDCRADSDSESDATVKHG